MRLISYSFLASKNRCYLSITFTNCSPDAEGSTQNMFHSDKGRWSCKVSQISRYITVLTGRLPSCVLDMLLSFNMNILKLFQIHNANVRMLL